MLKLQRVVFGTASEGYERRARRKREAPMSKPGKIGFYPREGRYRVGTRVKNNPSFGGVPLCSSPFGPHPGLVFVSGISMGPLAFG